VKGDTEDGLTASWDKIKTIYLKPGVLIELL